MAHTKTGGSTTLGRDSHAQRLGTKVTQGQKVRTGMVLVRQCGTKFRSGKNTGLGSDYTIFSLKNGTVEFKTKQLRNFDSKLRQRTIVSVS